MKFDEEHWELSLADVGFKNINKNNQRTSLVPASKSHTKGKLISPPKIIKSVEGKKMQTLHNCNVSDFTKKVQFLKLEFRKTK